MVKADGCVAVHADGGAYKPMNWMTAPNTVQESIDEWVVSNPKGETLTITIHELVSDVSHDLGVDPGLQKDGVEAHLQELLATDRWVAPPGSPVAGRDFESGYTGRDSRILKAVINAFEVTGEPFDRSVEVANDWALIWGSRFRVKLSRVELARTRIDLTASRAEGFGESDWQTLTDAFFRAVTIELLKLAKSGPEPLDDNPQ